MTPGGDLEGMCVLVLEDECYLADDVAYALQQAGASVMGPFAEASDAIAAIGERKPHCAVVDVNLGRGANFGPARALLGHEVPIVFVTGYDSEVIPEDLAHVPCLQKPTSGSQVVSAVSALKGAAP